MEQRKPQRTRRRVSPLLMICLLGSGLLLGGYWWLANSSISMADEDTRVSVRGTIDRSPAVTDTPAVSADGDEAARIVDDPAVDPSALGNATGRALTTLAPGPVDDKASDSNPFTDISSRKNVAATSSPVHAPSRPRVAGARSSHSQRNGPRATEPDLLATLMANIGRDPPSHAGTPSKGESAIDALVARIQHNRDENYTPSATALAKLGTQDPAGDRQVAASAMRSELVQSQLRECPKANTMAGISCRQRVCARYAGEDPACPR